MVEIPKDCVLQWAGHAGYITERFSGLLARQALVDVTLICDEQKLRVHKLVLASNSIYFEEILQQDLGQEPIILLKDLDFEILKAMVEFMYCGETTISHQHLSSLHTAAQIFQVKELVSVIDTIIDSKKISQKLGKCLKQQSGDCNLKVANVSLVENDYVRVRCDKLSMDDESTSFCTGSNNNDVSSTKHRFLEHTDMIDSGEHDLEHSLYEESVTTDVSKEEDVVDTSDLTLSASDVNISTQCNTIAAATITTTSTTISTIATTTTITNTTTTTTTSTIATPISAVSTLVGKVNEVQTKCIISNRDETYRDSPNLKPILYEQCCDLSCDVNERDQTATGALSRSCLPQAESDCSGSSTDVPSTVGRCVKVYTPKRRKSLDEARNKLVHTQCNLVPTTPSSTDSIDLLDEPSVNDVPVTLLTSLDMESAEYILSLSAESIQSIVGGTISDQHTVIGCKEISAERDADNERLNLLTSNADCAKPVLRRSTRLSQQESDETANNSPPLASFGTGTEKQFKKSNSPNRMELSAKTKRKSKEDRKVPDHGVVATATSGNRKNGNRKSNSKLIVKRSNKSSCTTTTNGGKEKEESKTKANSKFKADNTERSATLEQPTISTAKSNTRESIHRALWGDLSDALDWGNETDLLTYPTNTEIPFAVGLLPLRAALEKMQATPDYQPRKTRSSVAPMKQDMASSSLKRRNCTSLSDAVVLSKKQSCNNNNESPNTVCHIRIRAAPSQCMKSRKRLLSDSIASLPTTEIANDRQ